MEQSESMLHIFAPTPPFPPPPQPPASECDGYVSGPLVTFVLQYLNCTGSFWFHPPTPLPAGLNAESGRHSNSWARNSLSFMEPRNFTNNFEVARLRSQQPVIGPYHDPFPCSSSTFSNTFFSEIQFNISHLLTSN